MDTPFAFLSHAGEDKERFVFGFAEKLRSQGIEVWLDYWEMLPGDSLVDKIFEEGIKEADVFIVVLSRNSVQKPWVKEELNAAIVKKINDKCKVIPVVIDDCEIPEALQSTVWQKIADIENYDTELQRIVSSIYENPQKPVLGEAPVYVRLSIDSLPGLSQIDTVVLKASCEDMLERGDNYIATSNILERLAGLEINAEEVFESLEILAEKYFISPEKNLGSRRTDNYQVTVVGFEQFAKLFVKGFNELVKQTLVVVVNNNLSRSSQIASELKVPEIMVDNILSILESRKHVKLDRYIDGTVDVEVTVLGTRVARAA